MMKFLRNAKGAISIFLIIALIPMLTFAAIFVDSSRLKLGQAATSTAGDLALNTALSQYNNILKDMYGLFATSQNNDELLANLEEYFKDSIVASGIPLADSGDYVGSIMGLLGSQKGKSSDDILSITLDKFDVKPPTDADLANPVMLKKQIIEFMKYRAPLDLGMELLDSIKVFKDISERVKVISKQQKYYAEQKKVFSLCENAWKHFYYYSMTDWAPTEYYYNRLVWDFNGKEEVDEDYRTWAVDPEEGDDYESYYDKLNRVTKNVSLYLYNKEYFKEPMIIGLAESGNQALKIKYNNHPTKSGEIKKSSIGTSSDYDTIRDAISDVEKYIKAVKDAKKKDQYKKYVLVTADTYTIRAGFEVPEQFNREISENREGTYVYSIIKLKEAYDRLKGAKADNADSHKPTKPTKPPEPSVPSKPSDSPPTKGTNESDADYTARYNSWVSDWNAYYSAEAAHDNWKNVLIPQYNAAMDYYNNTAIPEWYKKYHDTKCLRMSGQTATYVSKDGGDKKTTSQQSTTLSNAETLIKEFSKLSIKVKNAYNAKKSEFEKMERGTNEDLKFVKSDSKIHYLDNIGTKIGNLSDANGYLGQIRDKLAPGGSLDNAMNSWESAANNPKLDDDETAKSQREEIANIKKIFTVNDVNLLITRVNNITESLKKTLEEIKSFKVGNQKKNLWMIPETYKGFSDNLDYTGFDRNYPPINDSSGKEDKSHIKVLENNYYYNNSKSSSLGIDQKIKTDWTEEYNPNPSISLGTTRFYQYLFQNFDTGKEPTGNEIKNKDEKDLENKKKEAKQEAENAKEEADNDSKNQSSNNISSSKLGKLPTQEWTASLQQFNDMNASTDADQDLDKVADGLSGMFSQILDLAKSAAVKLRDSMYIDNYILRMFSYDTYEAELVYNETENGMPISEKFFPSGSADSPNSKYSSQIAKAVSMTQTPINPANNFAYGSEVEYVLWGGNNTGNVVKTYATIFGIRLALNLVYAFTDSEIREGALAVATALFGVPPLTVLIPAAKVAIIIALAIAESAYDIYKLKKGEPVPIYKSSDTWVMKISHVFSELGGEMISAAIDKGYALLSDWLSKTSDELADAINSGCEELSEALGNAIEDKFDKYAFSALDALSDACNTAKQLEKVGELVNDNEVTNKVESLLDEWLSKQNINGAGDIAATVKQAAVDAIVDNGYIEQMLNAINETAQGNINAMKEKFASMRDTLKDTVANYINVAGNKINEAKDALMTQIQDAAANGADRLKDTITSNIDIPYGSGSGASTQRGTAAIFASLVSWQYSDYLTLFLIIATLVNEQSILLKTADVIQSNMQHVNKTYGASDAAKAFFMKKAYTYLTIDADVKVPPLLLPNGMLETSVTSELAGVDWYTIHYTATKGY